MRRDAAGVGAQPSYKMSSCAAALASELRGAEQIKNDRRRRAGRAAEEAAKRLSMKNRALP